MKNPEMGKWLGIGVAMGIGLGVLVGALRSRRNS